MKVIKSESSPELKFLNRSGQPFAFVISGDCTGHIISLGPSRMGKCSITSGILQTLLKQSVDGAKQNSELFKELHSVDGAVESTLS